jgi:hypothetical protein
VSAIDAIATGFDSACYWFRVCQLPEQSESYCRACDPDICLGLNEKSSGHSSPEAEICGIRKSGFPTGFDCCPGFFGGLWSLEGEASLRVGRAQRRRSGRRGCVLAEAERAREAEFEASEEQRDAVLERAGGGVMQDAQQQEGDQRNIDLDAHGVFTAAQEAADLEILLEPLEQQLDVPALFVELGDVGGGALEVIGQQIQRLVVIGRATVISRSSSW